MTVQGPQSADWLALLGMAYGMRGLSSITCAQDGWCYDTVSGEAVGPSAPSGIPFCSYITTSAVGPVNCDASQGQVHYTGPASVPVSSTPAAQLIPGLSNTTLILGVAIFAVFLAAAK
jgi:hypothetical protein